ncbi:hypothetical protein [Cochleicola gelatinilyticus]|uniref:Type VI secretion protein n=1 Tax=Cochleicola gelatinilyticus TaxID=1763537 RepID=A0A167HLS3_9FLAO|nr:hypothetical protein [Cochleicola gelatinilyticus]OAB78747.1 hypothetical protein ULVI_09195 [Cochleicola gelatinilyticus]
MNEDDFEKVYSELLSVFQNLKAEIIVAELQEKTQLSIEDVLINNNSTFNRPYRRDIIGIENIDNESRKLRLNLSRNGLYDLLPEGLFHSESLNKKATSFAGKRKLYKDQEKEARSLFSPIENELFFQRLQIEKNERSLLNDFYTLKEDFLINFWKIDKNIPREYLLKLVKLLPYSYQIAGDLELTKLCLERILNEKVVFKKTYENIFEKEERFKTESPNLGVNMILHSEQTEVLQPVIEAEIGPIDNEKIPAYIEKNGVLKFIEIFYDFFIPLEFKVKTSFKAINKNGFLIDVDNEPLMGISTRI